MDFKFLQQPLAESRQTINETLVKEIRQAIESGKWPEGTKLPPDKGLATALGINHITLAKALNQLRDLGLLQRRRARGTFVASKKCGCYAGKKVAVVFDYSDAKTFQCSLFLGLHRELTASGLNIVFYSADGSSERQCELLKQLGRDPSLAGAIFWSILDSDQAAEAAASVPLHFPLIFLDKTYEGIIHDAVTYDDFSSGEVLGHFLRKKGFNRIAWIQYRHGGNLSSLNRRFAGLCAGLGEVRPAFGLVAEQDAEVLVFSSDGDFDDFTAAGKSLDRPYYVFTTSANRPGVFFDVDSLAAEAVRLLRGRLYGSDIPGCRRVASWKFIETAEETVSSADVG